MEIRIIKKTMTIEESRKKFLYRPFSNFAESRWGGNNLFSDKDLLNRKPVGAKRCLMCSAPTKKVYLVNNDVCPDCTGVAQRSGHNPYIKITK